MKYLCVHIILKTGNVALLHFAGDHLLPPLDVTISQCYDPIVNKLFGCGILINCKIAYHNKAKIEFSKIAWITTAWEHRYSVGNRRFKI